jgi:LPXTG-motif cell wall-anchored protein
MKKLALLSALLFALATLAGCWASEVNTNTAIGLDGGGTRTVTIELLKDNAVKPDDPNSTVSDNESYFIGGFPALLSWVTANTPDGYTVTVTDDSDSYTFTMTYTFTNVADYNAKLTALVDGTTATFTPATYTSTAATVNGVEGQNGTYTENVDNAYASVAWAIEGIWNNSALFDPDPDDNGAIEIQDLFTLRNMTVTVGEDTVTKDLDAQANTSLTEIEISSFVSALPQTGENNNSVVMYLAFGSLIAAGALYVASNRMKKQTN